MIHSTLETPYIEPTIESPLSYYYILDMIDQLTHPASSGVGSPGEEQR